MGSNLNTAWLFEMSRVFINFHEDLFIASTTESFISGFWKIFRSKFFQVQSFPSIVEYSGLSFKLLQKNLKLSEKNIKL